MHLPPPTADDDQHLLNRMLSLYDAPAFMRRVKHVEEAERFLHEHLCAKRATDLAMVRLRVGQLHALAGDWDAIRPLLGDDASLAALAALHDELQPVLRLALNATNSISVLRRALAELVSAIEVFNHRWEKYLKQFDLTAINELRDGYNRNFLIEKECALRNSRIARLGFQRLEPLTSAELLKRFPPLAPPRLAS